MTQLMGIDGHSGFREAFRYNSNGHSCAYIFNYGMG